MESAVVTGADHVPRPGWVDEAIHEEFPSLRLAFIEIEASSGKSPSGVRQRLRDLSDRFRGAQAVAMRQQPIPWAYRVFYRQIGLDPDADRTPVEAAALERLVRGGFRPQNLLDDAITIALVETGVPIWALDGNQVDGDLGIRLTGADEFLGRMPEAPPLAPGRIVVADMQSPLAVLFGDIAPGHGVAPETRRMALFTVAVHGVPEIHVEEALWTCAQILIEGA